MLDMFDLTELEMLRTHRIIALGERPENSPYPAAALVPAEQTVCAFALMLAGARLPFHRR